MHEFRLRRHDLAEFCGRTPDDPGYDWGGQEHWELNIPRVFHALANPDAIQDFQRAPQPYEDLFGRDTSYWTSLLYLLVYSFGWSDPGLGLDRWIRDGRPTDDLRHALIEQTWVADGQFDAFCAWLWSQSFHFGPGAPEVPRPPLVTDRERLAQLASCVPEGMHGPFGGGYDPLHAASNIGMFHHLSEHDFDSISLSLEPDGGRHGTIVTPRLLGWMAFLDYAPTIKDPHPSGRSWKIDVVVRPIGWLGTYRRSRDTGRWFSGPHSLHLWGNRT